LPKELGSKIDWRLARAFSEADPAKGLEAAKRMAGELKADHPDAAASLLEGLEEMFTVRRLGISGRLASTLTSRCLPIRARKELRMSIVLRPVGWE
jgi:hypothetical protein